MSFRYVIVPCDHCPADIVWGNTGNAMMPVNAAPVPGGNVVLMPRAVGSPRVIVTNDATAHPDLPRYTSHFDTCPAATEMRRGAVRKTAAPPQTDTLF